MQHTQSLGKLRAALQVAQDRLTLQQLLALVAVAERPGLSVNELSELIAVSQPAASRSLGVLLGRYETDSGIPVAFVEQQINEQDPRRRAVYLTEAGAEFVAAIIGNLEGDK